MVQNQIEEKVNPAALWPGVSGEDLALWLFDAELTVERVATAGARAAIASAEIPASTRADLVGALSQLSRAIRVPQPEGLGAGRAPGPGAARSPVNLQRRPCGATPRPGDNRHGQQRLPKSAHWSSGLSPKLLWLRPPTAAGPTQEQRRAGLLPTTKQAIQVAVAASLAIVVGEAGIPVALVLGGDRRVRHLRRHQHLE